MGALPGDHIHHALLYTALAGNRQLHNGPVVLWPSGVTYLAEHIHLCDSVHIAYYFVYVP